MIFLERSLKNKMDIIPPHNKINTSKKGRAVQPLPTNNASSSKRSFVKFPSAKKFTKRTSFFRKRRKKAKIIWRGFIIRLTVLFFLLIFSVLGYFGFKFYRLQQNIYQTAFIDNQTHPHTPGIITVAKNFLSHQRSPLRGEDRGRINILLLGMGGEGHSGKYLTDTIIVASINLQTYQLALLSIPRDLYIQIPNSSVHTKINAVYAYGLSNQEKSSTEALRPLKKLIQEITGQPIDYYAVLDFEGFKKIINELGGIDVEVPEDILDTRYPGPNFSYQTFEIKKGFHHLDGETALKYARVRHTKGGDFGRARRQQQIMAAAKRKAFSLKTFLDLPRLNRLVNILGEHFKTDVSFSEIPSFLQLAREINIYQTTNIVLDAWSENALLASTHVPLGGVMAYVLLPRAKNYSQIQELEKNIFNLNLLKRKRDKIKQEAASVVVVLSAAENYYRLKNAFQKLGYQVTIKNRSDLATDRCASHAKIFSNTNPPKLFTLDDLATKLAADITYKNWPTIQADIVICLPADEAQYFNQLNQTPTEEQEQLKDQSIIDSAGNIRINQD